MVTLMVGPTSRTCSIHHPRTPTRLRHPQQQLALGEEPQLARSRIFSSANRNTMNNKNNFRALVALPSCGRPQPAIQADPLTVTTEHNATLSYLFHLITKDAVSNATAFPFVNIPNSKAILGLLQRLLLILLSSGFS